MSLTHSQLIKELLPRLNTLFGAKTVEYFIRPNVFRRYTVYRVDDYNPSTTAVLAKGLSKEEAEGMMKLLKEE